jgi:preprotein translocase SecE subunit
MTKKKLRKYKASLESSSSSVSLPGAKTVKEKSQGKPSVTAASSRGGIAGFMEFLSEVRAEFDRVSWAGKKEVKTLTIAVIGITFFFTFYLGLVDISLSELVALLMKS